MRTVNATKVLIGLIFITGLISMSCKKNNKVKPGHPVKVEDVNGNYTGKLVVMQGKARSESTITLSSQSNVISIDGLPVGQIVSSVIKDPAKARDAVSKLGKVKYDLNYTGKVNAKKTAVSLVLAPKDMELQVPVDNINKKVVVNIKARQTGSYLPSTKTLGFGLAIDRITVDGVAVAPFAGINYNFQALVKK